MKTRLNTDTLKSVRTVRYIGNNIGLQLAEVRDGKIQCRRVEISDNFPCYLGMNINMLCIPKP